VILNQAACPGSGGRQCRKGPLRPRAGSEPAFRTAGHRPGLFLGPAVPRADRCAPGLRPSGRRPADGRPLPRWRSAQPRGVPETAREASFAEPENARPAALGGSQAPRTNSLKPLT
jgi:hypothetical protein